MKLIHCYWCNQQIRIPAWIRISVAAMIGAIVGTFIGFWSGQVVGWIIWP